jgi:hypothetical protein
MDDNYGFTVEMCEEYLRTRTKPSNIPQARPDGVDFWDAMIAALPLMAEKKYGKNGNESINELIAKLM